MVQLKYHQNVFSKIWEIRKQSERLAVTLTYKLFGPSIASTNTHILMLHGLLGCKNNFYNVSEMIIKAPRLNGCVIVADARNHGDSPHTCTHNYNDLSEDAFHLIDKLGIDKVHLIGHSMGGRTAITMALTQPSRIKSLVVVDISPISSKYLNTNFFPTLLKVMKSVDFQGAKSLREARRRAAHLILSSTKVKRVGGVLFNISEKGEKKFVWQYNLDTLIQEFPNIVTMPPEVLKRKYLGPILLIAGEKSMYLPKEDMEGIKKIFPAAELVTVKKAGHNVHEDNPTDLYKEIVNFYKKNKIIG